MGAWGHRIFDNDDAADWVFELEESEGDGLLERTLESVATADVEDVEGPDAAAALAAGEVVAAALGGSRDGLAAGGSYAEGAVRWVDANGGTVRRSLAPLAVRALRCVRESSELRELWDEAGPDEWLAEIAALERRLEAAT